MGSLERTTDDNHITIKTEEPVLVRDRINCGPGCANCVRCGGAFAWQALLAQRREGPCWFCGRPCHFCTRLPVTPPPECSLFILVGTTAPCVPLLTTPLIAVQVRVLREVTLQINKLNYSSPLSRSPMRVWRTPATFDAVALAIDNDLRGPPVGVTKSVRVGYTCRVPRGECALAHVQYRASIPAVRARLVHVNVGVNCRECFPLRPAGSCLFTTRALGL